MSVKAVWATPMLHVAEIEKSIEFYTKLGFELIDTDDGTPLGLARIQCEGGAMMFLRAEHTIDPNVQGVMFTMYTPNLVALRERLVAEGVTVSDIKHPPYMPSGEVSLRDPDGFIVSVVHWSKPEHDAWLKRIGRTEV